jgi:hypothetical protein
MSIQNFKYNYFLENRHDLPKLKSGEMDYEAICNNGFTKLFTEKCRIYWLAQNEHEHKTPDWKFHVSVVKEDIPKSWDLLIELFIAMNCRSGMKVCYLKENDRTAPGREITIYIYKHYYGYDTSELCEGRLSIADEHSEDYWLDMFKRIECVLEDSKIRPNGCANGDLPLGKYVSIRNEVFVHCDEKDVGIYPPDECGWNALGHPLPFNIDKFRVGKIRRKNLAIWSYLILSAITILFFSNYIMNNL